MSRSPLTGADGVVRSSEIVLEFERTTPSAAFKGTGIFLDGAATPPLPRSIQSCPAGQLHNRKEVGGTKTKNLSAYFLERGVFASKTRANVQTPDPSFARMEYVLVQHSSHTQGNVFPLSRRFD